MRWVIPAIICVAAAALEGAAGGSQVQARLASLRMPRRAPPLPAWMAIGALYYLTCFAVLVRVLAMAAGRAVSLLVVLVLMLLNVLWTWLFFRRRRLTASAAVAMAYVPVAVGLFLLLWRHDRAAALLFLPYLIYLGYGTWWMLAVWQLNPGAGGTGSQRPA